MIRDEVKAVIEFAEAHKGPGWRVSSAVESFRYKDTGERLWSVNMFNKNVYTGGPGEAKDRLLITSEDGCFHARSVEGNRYSPTSSWRIKREAAQEGA